MDLLLEVFLDLRVLMLERLDIAFEVSFDSVLEVVERVGRDSILLLYGLVEVVLPEVLVEEAQNHVSSFHLRLGLCRHVNLFELLVLVSL